RPVNIAALSDEDLVKLHQHRNDRYVRHARRVLQERMAAERDMSTVHAQLHESFASNPDVTRTLRSLWTLHALIGLTDGFLAEQLEHESEHVRAWAVRLLCEDRDPPDAALQKFQQMARHGDSPLVRLHLASALQRLELAQRWPLAEALASRPED